MSASPTCITAPQGTPFIEVVRDFDAPRELVFRASTDPDLVVRWLGPGDIQTFEFEGVPGVVSLEIRSLHDLGGRTRLEQSAVFPSVAARDQAIASGMERGITQSMECLGELLGSRAGQR